MFVLRFIFVHLDQFRHRFAVVFFVGILDGAAVFLIPVLLAESTKGTFELPEFRRLLPSVIGLYLTSLGLQWILRRYGEALGPQFGNHLRTKYFAALERLPYPELTRRHSGYLLSLVNKVADGVPGLVFDMFWTFTRGIVNIVLFFLFTARESVSMAFLNLLVLLVFVSVSAFLARRMVPLADALNAKRASLMEQYADFLANVLTLKKLGVFPFARQRLGERTRASDTQIQTLQNFHANRWLLLHALYGLALFSTIGFLLFQVASGQTSASVLILFVVAYVAVRQNIERLSETIKDCMELGAYVRTLDGILSSAAPNVAIAMEKPWQAIRFEEVAFQHAGATKRIAIPGFEMRRGDVVCVTGTSGEGKSTFLNLLAGFLEPQEGRRLVDGTSYAELPTAFFRDRIAFISQEVELFNLSLRENLTLGKAVGQEDLDNLLSRVGLLEWVHQLDAGLETVVGEKGVKLSAGQKQRVNLVRGILLDRDVYLLDEPTAHLDAETERQVVDLLRDRLRGKTAVIVSHREALRAICSRQYVMEGHTLREK